MRDLVVAAAAVCAVSGLVLAAMPAFDNKAVSWFVGFCVGCLAASILWALAVIWAM
jgi:hypothetical protein